MTDPNAPQSLKMIEERIIEIWPHLQDAVAVLDHLPDEWEVDIVSEKTKISIALRWDGEEVIRIEREPNLPLQKIFMPEPYLDRKAKMLGFIADTGDRIAAISDARARSQQRDRELAVLKAIDQLI